MNFEPQSVQILKLLIAFLRIKNPATRHMILALTESTAVGAGVPSPYFEQMQNLLRRKTT